MKFLSIIIFQASIQSHIEFWVLYCFSWQSYKCTHNLFNSVVKPVTTKYHSLVPMSVLVCFSVTMIKHCPRPACWRKGVCQLAGYSSPLEKTEARSQDRRWSRVLKKCCVLFKCVIVLLAWLCLPLLMLVLLFGWYFLLLLWREGGSFSFFNFRISVSFFFWYFNFLLNISSLSFDLSPKLLTVLFYLANFLFLFKLIFLLCSSANLTSLNGHWPFVTVRLWMRSLTLQQFQFLVHFFVWRKLMFWMCHFGLLSYIVSFLLFCSFSVMYVFSNFNFFLSFLSYDLCV